jgi:hypothetical protein
VVVSPGLSGGEILWGARGVDRAVDAQLDLVGCPIDGIDVEGGVDCLGCGKVGVALDAVRTRATSRCMEWSWSKNSRDITGDRST